MPPTDIPPDPLRSLYANLDRQAESARLAPTRKGMHPIVGKIGMGLFCSTIVTIAMNFLYIKKAILYACSVVVAFGGADPDVEKFKEKAKERIAKEVEKEEGGGPRGGILSRIPTPDRILEEKGKEAVGNATSKGKEVVEKAAAPVRAGVHKVEEKAEEGVTALRALGSQRSQPAMDPRLAATAPGGLMGRNQLSGLREERANQLMEEQANYGRWWAIVGPNGKCPACKSPMKVSVAGKGAARCYVPNCSFRTTANKARAMGSPEPPTMPPPAYFAWKKAEADKAQKKATQQ